MLRKSSFVVVMLLAAGLLAGTAAQAELTIETFVVRSGDDAVPALHPYFSSDGSTLIDMTISGEAGIPLYYISTDPTLPVEPVWQEYADLELAPAVSQGKTTFYAWAKDGEVIAGPAEDWIAHSTDATTITVFGTVAGYFSVTVEWETTDVASIGWLEYREADSGGAYQISEASPNGFAELHTIELTGLIDETEYDIVIHSNGASLAYPMTTIIAPPTDGNVTWSGGAAPDNNWSLPKNWLAGQPPNNPTPGTVTFNTTSTSRIDPDGDTWTIARFSGRSEQGVSPVVDVDLNSKRLTILNELLVQNNWTSGGGAVPYLNVIFRNGTLRVGDPQAKGNLRTNPSVSFWSNRRGETLTIDASTVLEPYIDTVQVGSDGTASESSILDIRGVDLAPEFNGVLELRQLIIGASWPNTHLLMDDTTGIDTLSVSETFRIGYRNGGIARIGDPDDDWKLPEGMNVVIGERPDEGGEGGVQANLQMFQIHNRPSGSSWFILNGGDFDAYLNELVVGIDLGPWGDGPSAAGAYEGLLDLRNAGEFSLNAVTTRIAVTPAGNTTAAVYGKVYLPEGNATTQTLEMGNIPRISDSAPRNGSGLLELNGTNFTVTQSVQMRTNSQIVVKVEGKSCGLQLENFEPAALAIEAGSTIEINFNAEELLPDSEQYYGLKWKGTHVTDINNLHPDKITWSIDESITGKIVDIVAEGGYTYIALVDEAYIAPPVAFPQDLTVPLIDGSVTVTANEVEYGSTDPEGLELTFTLTYGDQVDVDELTFTELGTYEIIFKATNSEGASAQAGATINVIEEAAWLAIDFTWSGAEPAGNEWSWRKSWLVDGLVNTAAVPNPAEGLFTFNSSATSYLDPEGDTWTIAKMLATSPDETESTIVVDLNSKRLTILDEIRLLTNWDSGGGPARWTDVTFLNGTLQIGESGAPGDLVMNDVSYYGNRRGQIMTIDPTATFEPYINILRVGSDGSHSESSILDIRGVSLAPEFNRTLAVNHLIIGDAGPNAHLMMDENTGIDTISVKNVFRVGYRSANSARIGDPDDGWKLPPGVDVIVGDEVAGVRGNLRIFQVQRAADSTAWLILNGGDFDGYLDELIVGIDLGPFGDQPIDTAYYEGLLDLSNAGEFSLDALTVRIAVTPAGDRKPAIHGKVHLPEGNATAQTLEMGNSSDREGTGLLELNGTNFEVTDSLTLRKGARVVTNVGSTSCGLNLGDFTPTFIDDAVIEINFLETPGGAGRHHGLRWEGDKTTDLQPLMGDRIVVDTSALDDPLAGWDIEYDDVEDATYVVLSIEAPQYSTYAFDYAVPEPVFAGVDVEVAVTLANEEPAGTVQYDAVRIAIEATGPDGAEVAFSGTDHTGAPYGFTNNGYWGPAEGFSLPAEYSDTLDWTLNFSQCGEYTITFTCYEIGSEAEPFAVETQNVSVYLYGDADLSGNVDLLDLVFVRNKLFETAGPGGQPADIDGDGSIDLEDLIEVRNNLGAVCEE